MPPLPETILLVLPPFAPLFSHRVWCHAQLLLLGAIVALGARTVTAALRAMGLPMERRFTTYQTMYAIMPPAECNNLGSTASCPATLEMTMM